MSKVMLAMSGGVDSSVAAALLLEAGYEIEGITMYLGDMQVVEKAAAAAADLGIKHHWVDLEQVFEREVKQYFIEEYRQGRTPNPCVNCNRMVKLGELYRRAEAYGFDYFATGHYAKVARVGERSTIARAAHLPKDQSYVLYALRPEVVSHLLLPLGELSKDEVRQKGAALGLAAAAAKDSQDICFIPDGDYRGFLAAGGLESRPGNFVDRQGKVLGTHRGIASYTIGQRKGLGIALGHPVFVTAIRPASNEVVLGLEPELCSTEMLVTDCNLLSIESLTAPLRAEIKIRYKSPAAAGTLHPLAGGDVRVVFDRPAKAVTPGQSAVFYDGDLVIGGGTIVRAEQ